LNKAELHIPVISHHGYYEAPASWTEMTRKHLLLWAATMSSRLPVSRALQVLAAALYAIDKKAQPYILPSEYTRLGKSVAFLLGKNGLRTWLVPVIRHRLRKYYGPKSELGNITVEEFTLCELCLERYQQTGEVKYLETLAAILYRPRRWRHVNDDIRKPLTVHGYVKRSKRFAALPHVLKVAIYLNYEGCRNFLHDRHKDVFQKGNDKAGNAKPGITSWSTIVQSAAGDIFGPLESTRQSNLHDFLSRLGVRMKEAREFEAKYGKS
jgi:hypothetical protein